MRGGVLSESAAGEPAAPGGFQASNDGNTVGHCFSSRMPDAASAPANSTPPVHVATQVPVYESARDVVPTGGAFLRKQRHNARPQFAKPNTWTDERRELLRREWLALTPGSVLLDKLNALPGDPLRAPQMYGYAVRVLRLEPRRAHMSVVWTSERDELLAREYVAGTSVARIREMCHALPGNPIKTAKAIKERARLIGVRRAPDFKTAQIMANRFQAGSWNSARDAMLRELWPQKALSTAEIANRISALDGGAVTVVAVTKRARKIQCPPRPKGRAIKAKAPAAPKPAAPKKAPPRFVPYAAPAPAPEPPPEYDATRATSMEARMEKARAAFRVSMNADPAKVGLRTGLPMRLVLQAKGDVRREAA